VKKRASSFNLTEGHFGLEVIHLGKILRKEYDVSHYQGIRVSRVAYKVSVSDLQGLVDAIADLTRSSLPGTISQLTVAENTC
jgi:hypothetical protein